MPELSDLQLATVRTHPHKAFHWLVPVQSGFVLLARVNDGAITVGARVIAYDDPDGDYADIEEGMTVWIGSSFGQYDVGKARAISATSTEIVISENSDIDWADDLYIAVRREWLPWNKRPRIVAGVVYKDYNVAYSDQTINWPPQPMMGDPSAKLWDETASFQGVYLDGSESYAIKEGATIVSWAWDMPGGTPSSSTDKTPGYVTVAAAGTYWWSLTVTDSSGTVSTRHNPYVWFDPLAPVLGGSVYDKFNIESMEVAVDGSLKANIRVFGDASLGNFPERAPIFVIADERYGEDVRSVGFPFDREQVKCFGYIVERSVRKDPITTDVTFTLTNVAGIVEKLTPLPFFVSAAATPADWTEAQDLTMQRALFFCIKFHSTLCEVADVEIFKDDTPVRDADFPEGQMWEQFAGYAKNHRLMRGGVTKTGRVVVGLDPQMVEVANRDDVTQVMQLSAGDWQGEITFTERDYPENSFIDLEGIYWSGVIGDELVPILSIAPGHPPKDFGRQDKPPGLWIGGRGQDEGNIYAGLVLGVLNNRYGPAKIQMTGNWWNCFDPALQEYIKMPAAGIKTKERAAHLSNARLIVRAMNAIYQWQKAYFATELTCEVESFPELSTTGDYPTNIDPPPIGDPPPKPKPKPKPKPFPDSWHSRIYMGTDKGAFYTTDFASGGILNPSQPVWSKVVTGLANSNVAYLRGDPVDPNAYQYALLANGGPLYLRSNQGSWSQIATASQLTTQEGFDSRGQALLAIDTNINLAAGYISLFYVGNGGPLYRNVYMFESSNYGSTWTLKSALFPSNSIFNASTNRPSTGAFKISSAYGAGSVIYAPLYIGGSAGDTWLKVSTDGGATWTTKDTTHDYNGAMAVRDPSEQDVLFVFETNSGSNGLYRSTNLGVSYGSVQLSGDGNSYWYGLSVVYNSLAAATKWRAFGGTNNRRLYVTTNSGASYTNVDISALSQFRVGGISSQIYGLSIVDNSEKKLYIFPKFSQPDSSHHNIYASSDDGITTVGKGGSDRSSGTTTGIPFDAAVTDILQVWNVQ